MQQTARNLHKFPFNSNHLFIFTRDLMYYYLLRLAKQVSSMTRNLIKYQPSTEDLLAFLDSKKENSFNFTI